MSDYPERPQLFALHYIKWLCESEVAQEIGPDALALLVAVVTKEDDLRYQRAVRFFNDQLASRCGIVSVHSLIRARSRAVDAGLLDYEPGAKRRQGRYFVCGFSAQSAGKAEGIRNESAMNPQPYTPNPIPNPNPNPIPKKSASASDADPDLVAWIVFWNGLKADGLVHAGTSPKPAKGVLAGWKRVQRSAELRDLLSDREAIREAIRESDFVRGPWFKLEKLLGGTNKTGAYIVQNLLDGCYVQRPDKPRTANVGAGVNYDPTKELTWN